jgi:hypothetical protein
MTDMAPEIACYSFPEDDPATDLNAVLTADHPALSPGLDALLARQDSTERSRLTRYPVVPSHADNGNTPCRPRRTRIHISGNGRLPSKFLSLLRLPGEA